VTSPLSAWNKQRKSRLHDLNRADGHHKGINADSLIFHSTTDHFTITPSDSMYDIIIYNLLINPQTRSEISTPVEEAADFKLLF